MSKQKNTRKQGREILAQTIYNETKLYYENGNQSKLYAAVWRKVIKKKYGFCYKTYLQYIKLAKRMNGESVILYSKDIND